MKYFELTKEEKQIAEALSRSEYKSAKNLKSRKSTLRKMAVNTLNKNKNINIRLSESDLLRLKRIAAEKGLPYQSLVSSILHQYASEKIEIEV